MEVRTHEIQTIHERYGQVKGELDDLGDVIHREREDLMDRIRELTREIRTAADQDRVTVS